MSYLCITVRFLDDRYHGLLGRDGPPEWPPSPFRLFQALLAGIGRAGKLDSEPRKALFWLESLYPPLIFAPPVCAGQVVMRFVPNNDGDRQPDRQMRLAGKTSRPTIMLGTPEIHYLWPVDEPGAESEAIIQVARYLSCLGWGIDTAFARGQLLQDDDVRSLAGIRWFPRSSSGREDFLLRFPINGSTADLLCAHESAIHRIEEDKPLRTVDKPKIFDTICYSSIERPIGRPYVVFTLRNARDDFYRHPHAKLIHIAGMTRNACIRVMGLVPPPNVLDTEEWVKSFVAGHRGEPTREHKQLSYLPLPSIGHEHSDALIRRIMIMAPFGCEAEVRHITEQLDGEELQPESGGDKPILEYIRSDGVTRSYVDSSRVWASVTPVILPGHDDHKPEKTKRLIEKALTQSGIDQECTYTWGGLPNFSNCLPVFKYDRNGRRTGYFRPDHLADLTAVHVRLRFKYPVTGPLAIGAGRHCGLGLFAAINGE